MQAIFPPGASPAVLLGVFGSFRRDGLQDQGPQNVLIHIRELLDVNAAFTGSVLTELSSQCLGFLKPVMP